MCINLNVPQTQRILQESTYYDPQQFQMVYEYLMAKDWEYMGHTFNLLELGYSFGYNNNKRRLGVHKRSGKRIEISQAFLNANAMNKATMENTIRHEIAHAIDWEVRGCSDHSWHWVRVAHAVGCTGDRCTVVKNQPKGKYTLRCPNGHEEQMHRRPKRHRSCGECNPHRYDERYKFQIFQNY